VCVRQCRDNAGCATGRGSSSAGFGLVINCIGLIANFSPAKAGFTVGQSSFTAVLGRQHNCFPSALVLTLPRS
jgi:hypothetical protein